MSIATEITRLQTAKAAIATAIGAKGVTVPPTTHIDGYAALVDQIASGGSGGSSGGAPLEWSEAYWQNILDNAWTRPADWLALPNVGDTESKFVGLHAVHENSNFLALSAAGNYTVDWGDGTVENFTSGATAYHQYDYNNAALNGTLSSRGYKQAIVTVTPQAGQTFTSLNLNLKHNQSGLLQTYSSGWLDILISGPNLSSLTLSAGTLNVVHRLLEQAQLISPNAISSFLYLFNGCNVLQSLPVWVVKTTGAVNMSGMFNSCSSLQTVPLFSTAAVTIMSNMFNNCSSLQTVPLFNTQAVTDMGSMFYYCSSLQPVPLFNTAVVTNMSGMFYGCYSLQTVPLFNTQAVTNMSSMFGGCYSLQTVPLFNTAAVTNMLLMFQNCSSLQTVPLFSTQAVTNMSSMFQNCSRLQTVPLFNTAVVTNMSGMFYGCYSLQTVPLFNTQAVTNMSSMFSGCSSLQTVPLFNTQAVTNMGSMFGGGCRSLQTVPLFNTAAVTIMSNMFNNCSSLQTVPALNASAVTSSANLGNIFTTCPSLSRIAATGFKYTFSVAICKLSAAALDEIYTNLPTVTGQTITVSGNWGTATDNPSIATAKGWTVTG